MTSRARALSGVAFATLVFIAFMTGSGHVAARLAFDHGVSVATAVVARAGVTALVMGAFVLAGHAAIGHTRRERWALAVIGVLVGFQSLWLYESVARLPVALALLVFNTYPLLTVLWARLIYRQRLHRSLLLAMGILLVGLALALDVFGTASGLGMAAQWRRMSAGVLYGLGSAALFGLALTLTQYEAAQVDGRVRTFATMLITALIALAGAESQGGLTLPAVPAAWWGLVLLTVLYGIGVTILFTIVPRWGLVGNTAILNIEPVFALVLAWIFLHQHMAPMQVAGAVIVVGAVVVVGLRRG